MMKLKTTKTWISNTTMSIWLEGGSHFLGTIYESGKYMFALMTDGKLVDTNDWTRVGENPHIKSRITVT